MPCTANIINLAACVCPPGGGGADGVVTSGNWGITTPGVITLTRSLGLPNILINIGSIDDLSDVDITTTPPNPGDALVWTGTEFEPAPGTGDGVVNGGDWGTTTPETLTLTRTIGGNVSIPLGSIDELSDVDTTAITPVLNNALIWDGSDWVPGTPGATPVFIDEDGETNTSNLLHRTMDISIVGGVPTHIPPGQTGVAFADSVNAASDSVVSITTKHNAAVICTENSSVDSEGGGIAFAKDCDNDDIWSAIVGGEDNEITGNSGNNFIGGSENIRINSSGETAVIGSAWTGARTQTIAFANQSAVIACLDCEGRGTQSAIIASEDCVSASSPSESAVIGSNNCQVRNIRQVMLASQNVDGGFNGTRVQMGFSAAAQSTANRTIELQSIGGNIFISGSLTSSHVFPGLAEVMPNFNKKEIPYGTIVTLKFENGHYGVIPAQENDKIAGIVKHKESGGVILGDVPTVQRYELGKFGERIKVNEVITSKEHQDYTDDVYIETDEWLNKDPEIDIKSISDLRGEYSIVEFIGQVHTLIDNTVLVGEYIKSNNGIGTYSEDETSMRVLKINEYDNERIALVLLKVE